VVEHFLGKEGVTGSIPVVGSGFVTAEGAENAGIHVIFFSVSSALCGEKLESWTEKENARHHSIAMWRMQTPELQHN
jgi:hypothetical protein